MEFSFFRNENEAFRLFRPLAYDKDGIFVCDDLTLGFGLICTPVSGWDSQMISSISFALKDPYPDESMLTFSLISSPDIKKQLINSDRLRSKVKNNVLRKTNDIEYGFLWGGASNPVETIQNTSVRHMQVLIIFKMPVDSIDVSDKERDMILGIKRQLEQRINKTPLSPKTFDDLEYINLMNSLMHWDENAEWRKRDIIEVDETVPLNEQILQYNTKICKSRNGIKLSSPGHDTFCSMLTARRMPKQTQVGMAIKWFFDPFEGSGAVSSPFIITANIFFQNQSSAKKRFERKRNHYLKISTDRLSKFAPKINVINEQIDESYGELGTDEKLVRVSLNAIIFGRDEQAAEDGKTAMQSRMADSGLAMIEEDSYSLPTFITHLPFGACSASVVPSMRYFTMTTRSVVAILPIFGEWQGTGTPVMNFVGRGGQLISFDIFDSTTNFGLMIYAESGAGKSMLANEIVRSYLSVGASVWLIDAGESYKKTSEILNGNYIAFNEEKQDISLNMFTMIDDEDEEAFSENVEMLAGAILAMTFIKDEPSDRQSTEVESIITKVWHKHGKASLIDHVRDECLGYKDERISDIGHQLEPFCSGGRFGRYFDKPHNVEFRGDFNVLELDGLSDTPRLQSVVLFMLMIQISNELYKEYKKDRNKKKIIAIDEAWQLIGGDGSPAVAKFFSAGFRKWRKMNASGCIITQNISDIRNSDAGRAIVENAATSLILKQKESSIKNAEKENLMALPEGGYKILKKVVTHPGHYSEIFISTNRGMGIGRLIVDPLRILMYSTKSEDNAAIEQYQSAGVPLGEALMNVAIDRKSFRYKTERPKFLDCFVDEFKSRLDVSYYLGIDEKDVNEAFDRKDYLKISNKNLSERGFYLSKSMAEFDHAYELFEKEKAEFEKEKAEFEKEKLKMKEDNSIK